MFFYFVLSGTLSDSCGCFRTLPGFTSPFWTGGARSRLSTEACASPQTLTEESSYSERGVWKGSRQGKYPEDLLCYIFYSVGIAWCRWICVIHLHSRPQHFAGCLWALFLTGGGERGLGRQRGELLIPEGCSVLWLPPRRGRLLSPCLRCCCPFTGMPAGTSPGSGTSLKLRSDDSLSAFATQDSLTWKRRKHNSNHFRLKEIDCIYQRWKSGYDWI